jgi:hypothetical protein
MHRIHGRGMRCLLPCDCLSSAPRPPLPHDGIPADSCREEALGRTGTGSSSTQGKAERNADALWRTMVDRLVACARLLRPAHVWCACLSAVSRLHWSPALAAAQRTHSTG